MFILKKRKLTIIIELLSLILMTIILIVLISADIPKLIFYTLLSANILMIFLFLNRLINKRTLYIRKNNFIVINAMNGYFLFNLEEIESVMINQSFCGKVFDYYTITIKENNSKYVKLYLTDNLFNNSDLLNNTNSNDNHEFNFKKDFK